MLAGEARCDVRRRRKEAVAAAAAGGFGGSGGLGTMSVRLSEGAIAVSGSGWAAVDLVLARVGGEGRAWVPGPARSRGDNQARIGAWSWGVVLVQR